MKSFFVILFVFITLLDKEVVVRRQEDNALKERNYRFLYDFFEEDTTKINWYYYKDSTNLAVFINLQNQKLSVVSFTDTFHVVLEAKISSGKHKGSTPKGEFKILKKRLSRASRKYGGVMTFWNCLTDDESIGIHGLKDKSYEKYLGKPASHGCIRVSTVDAITLYDVPIGTKVLIE